MAMRAFSGRKILLDRKPYVVIGVMPRDFEFPLVAGHLNQSELWTPFSFTERRNWLRRAAANWSYGMVMARLKDGVSAAQAVKLTRCAWRPRRCAIIKRLWPRLQHSPGGYGRCMRRRVEQARPLVRTLFLAVACGAADCLREPCRIVAGAWRFADGGKLVVRLALGARAATLLRQAILESLVLSVAGGVIGPGSLAGIALKGGLGNCCLETLPRINEIGLDWPVVGFALALAVMTGVVCGLAPAFAAIRTSVNDTLKEGGRTGTSGGGHARLRSALVVGEIAVALVLLAASGLLLRSFEKMRQVNLGFQPDHTLVASYGLPRSRTLFDPGRGG